MKIKKNTTERPIKAVVASKKITWVAVAISLGLHAMGFAALVTWITNPKSSRVLFAGREQAFQWTLSLAEPQWDVELLAVDEFETAPPVVIEPHQARVSEHTFVQVPTHELPADDLFLEPAIDSTAQLPEFAALDEVHDLPGKQAPTASEKEQRQASPKPSSTQLAVSPSLLGTTEDSPPDLSRNTPPVYPAHAIQSGWKGTVLLRVWIDKTGKITKVEIARGSGFQILDGAAVNAVRQWSATPAKRGGKPVTTIEMLPVCFEL